MCTCIIITIPNFRGNLCNKNSMSIYFWDAAFLPYGCRRAAGRSQSSSIPRLASVPPAAPPVPPLGWALRLGLSGSRDVWLHWGGAALRVQGWAQGCASSELSHRCCTYQPVFPMDDFSFSVSPCARGRSSARVCVPHCAHSVPAIPDSFHMLQ